MSTTTRGTGASTLIALHFITIIIIAQASILALVILITGTAPGIIPIIGTATIGLGMTPTGITPTTTIITITTMTGVTMGTTATTRTTTSTNMSLKYVATTNLAP